MFKPVTPIINFPEMERKILEGWYKRGIVKKYLTRNNASKKRFSFLDGPITANNPMGVHHAWGRMYKDLWQRFYTMRGYRERYQNGFDCQGLWVEVEVEKELGIRNKQDIENLVPGDKKASIARFVQLCKDRVLKFSAMQTEQTIRLGNFMDWDHSYYTMSDENNYMIWHFLKVCHEKGWIYKGEESVPWCPRCETAISQHEMLTEDYKELVHKSVYMRLPIFNRDNEYLLVWTTTPWTIPANIAVAVDDSFDYVLVSVSNEKYWVLSGAADRLFGSDNKIIKKVKGSALLGLKYRGAFDDLPAVKKAAVSLKFHTVIPTDPHIMPITATEGTGLVHTAVSAGEEDFKLGRILKLPMIPVIADNADYLPDLGFLSGENAKKHPEIILDYMLEHGFAWKIENYKHRYPACWRCKTELVWKVAMEWYIAMDVPEKIKVKKGKTLREQMIEVAKMIKWHPGFGLERELDWLTNMHDWLISKKNRYWGLALPIYECTCGWFSVIGSKEELRLRAVEGWSEFDGKSPHKPYIDTVKIRCDNCGKTVPRLNDVGNVWLDAGIVSFSTLVDPKTHKLSYTTDKAYWQEWFPADFITESFPGQFKNWFYSLIAMSTVLEKKNPFISVLGFASMLGEDGRPMHKSWGNAIEFNEGADTIGVDVMRWMFAIQNPEQNLLFGPKRADETRRKFHLLLWNVYNFFITYANVDNLKIDARQKIKPGNILDKWIISKLNGLIKTVTEALANYDPSGAAQAIEAFVTDLSQWFVRRSRDRVGPTVESGADKDSCHRTLYTVLTNLSKLLAPFTPFISDEIYCNLSLEESVHLADWPEYSTSLTDKKLEEAMQIGRTVATLGHSYRKENNLKVRIPLLTMEITTEQDCGSVPDSVWETVLAELNTKNLIINKTIRYPKKEVIISEAVLYAEGEARGLVRQIQIKRKEMGCALADKILLELPEWSQNFTEYITRETLATKIIRGPEIKITRV